MVIYVGRQRDCPEGWCACVEVTKTGWFRDATESHQFFKRDGENYWEDEDGWFVDPETGKRLDDAVKHFADWQR